MSTIYKIDFDLTPADQVAVLDYLQKNNYKLMGYKGATGPNQLTDGVPTWFAEPFIDMFGAVEIDYEPLYKVYVFNQHSLGTYTTIQMQALSEEIPLGSAIQFNADGTFSAATDIIAPDGIITVLNNRPAGTENVTVGLAAKVNGQYLPFCAFTATPQGSVSMAPNEKVLLFAAQTDLVSGSVAGNATSPGCTFVFNSSGVEFDLKMIPGTLGITSAEGGRPVTAVGSGSNLQQILNTKD